MEEKIGGLPHTHTKQKVLREKKFRRVHLLESADKLVAQIALFGISLWLLMAVKIEEQNTLQQMAVTLRFVGQKAEKLEVMLKVVVLKIGGLKVALLKIAGLKIVGLQVVRLKIGELKIVGLKVVE